MCHLCSNWLANCSDDCSQSPLLHHLSNAEHEQVSLRNDVQVGKTALECSQCGHNNDLTIGFASVGLNSVAVGLSRQTEEPCNRQWKELTDNVHHLSYMVTVPLASSKKSHSEKPRICVTHIPPPCSTLLTSQDPVLPSRFTNGTEYVNFFNPLIKQESDFQKHLNESTRTQVDIKLRWEEVPNKKVRAYFILKFEETVWMPKLGEKLRLRHIGNGTNWTGIGRIVKLPQNYDEEVGLEMEKSEEIPRNCTTGFSVTRVWISTSYDRMVSALQKFTSKNSSNPDFLYEQILGIRVEDSFERLSEWELPPTKDYLSLSAQQENVIKYAMRHSLTLIQGPAASGKTDTLLGIALNLVHKGRILVCAYTNNVVDHLAVILNKKTLTVVRLFAVTQPSEKAETHFLSLDYKIRSQLPPEFRKVQKLLDEGKELSSKETKKYYDWRKKTEHDLLEKAEVICCTCIAAGDERLTSLKFHTILIDETKQATEPECIIPIALGCEKLVLVYDHFQLDPAIKCKEASKAGLKRSLFERLVNIGVKPQHLTAQYRMHPKLWHFPAVTFYDGSSLPSGVSAAQRELPDQALPWIDPDFPFMFYNVRGYDETTEPVKSYINKNEAKRVEQIVTRLLKRGISSEKIGVITQFEGQRKYLRLYMEDQGELDTDRYRKIEVDKVDAFQGREKDIIIVSCVQSLGNKTVGSLVFKDRFFLALTRAKFGLIIIGHAIALSKFPTWNALLLFCQKQGVLVEGELDDLKQSTVKIS